MYHIDLCKGAHEYIEVVFTTTNSTSMVKKYYQCRLCGNYLNDSQPKINEMPITKNGHPQQSTK
jgi:hypothetical protein